MCPNEIALAGIKEKASAHDDAKATAQRTAGQRVKQNCDCSQIEEEDDWNKENQMGRHWDEEEKLEEVLGRRRMEGSFLQVEVMQKVPEIVVHERMSQVERTKCAKEKKKVKGGSSEEMLFEANSFWEEEMKNMETDESTRDGSMLGDSGGKNRG